MMKLFKVLKNFFKTFKNATYTEKKKKKGRKKERKKSLLF